MNINTILDELRAKYGTDWPHFALIELCNLRCASAEIEDKTDLSNPIVARYHCLATWVEDTFRVGIVIRIASRA